MNRAVEDLLLQQCSEWPLCGENYEALKNVEVKELAVGTYIYKVQFNPKRILSSAAKVDAQSIRERKCFLCTTNRPEEQRKIDFTSKAGNRYEILVNPYPIFRKHLTIPSVEHQPQRIYGKIGDMLELAEMLDEYLIFYNGPKCGASAPDHFHFQAGNKGFLPVETDMPKLLTDHGKAVYEGVYTLEGAPAGTAVAKSDNYLQLSEWFDAFFARFAKVSPAEEEPMMNILAWKSEGVFYLVVYPRRQHRPAQFFAEGVDNILISPASIDLGGVFITPLEKDYVKISENDIRDILIQVSVTEDTLNELMA